MTQGVDFLRAEREKELAKAKARRPVKAGSIVFLIFYCLVVAATFSSWLIFSRSSEQVKKEISFKKQRISSLKKTESLQVLLKQRLSLLTKIVFEKKLSYSEILLYFEENSSEGLSLNNFKLTDEGEVDISGVASNAVALSDFLKNLISEQSEKVYFSKIILSSLNRNADGDYKFSLLLEADEKL